MSTFVIGDIHGCLDQLEKLIAVLRAEGLNEQNDTLIFVGDYIDRGPDSRGVVDFLIQLKTQIKCVFLAGNHEEMFLDWLRLKDLSGQGNGSVFIMNGGDETLKSYHAEGMIFGRDFLDYFPPSHREFFLNLEVGCIAGPHVVVHAGLSWNAMMATTPEEALEFSSNGDLLWIRDTWRLENSFGGTVIYGHTPRRTGVLWHHRPVEGLPPYSVGIDTGCVFKFNPLVALRLEDWRVFSAGW